jgi:hypothetical protein
MFNGIEGDYRYYVKDNNNKVTDSYYIFKAYQYNVTGADGTVKIGYVVKMFESNSAIDRAYDYYYMVPADYTGNVSLTINGSKLVKNKIVENTADSHTFLVK